MVQVHVYEFMMRIGKAECTYGGSTYINLKFPEINGKTREEGDCMPINYIALNSP